MRRSSKKGSPRITSALAAMLAAAAVMLTFAAVAASPPSAVTLSAASGSVTVRKMPEGKASAVPSLSRDGVMWVSMTDFADVAGFKHSQGAFGSRLTFTNDRGRLSFVNDNVFYMVDTATAILPLVPVRHNSKLYLPARDIVAAFGTKFSGTLSWDEKSLTITVNTGVSADTSKSNARTPSVSASTNTSTQNTPTSNASAPSSSAQNTSAQNTSAPSTSTQNTPTSNTSTQNTPTPTIPQLPAEMSFIRTIVIDPGHGGRDPGATGPSGIMEKNVVLGISLELKKLLERAGFTVYMTRDKDVFVPLRDRTNFANEKKADLFVSIHANAIGDRRRQATMRGYKIYFLSQAKNEEDKMAAMRENAVIELEDSDQQQNYDALQDVLISIAGAEYLRESQELSIMMEQTFGARQKRIPRAQLGVGQANFWVLNGAFMPAVLVEAGYISHPEEEKLLADKKVQEQLAAALSESIIKFKRLVEGGQ